MCTHTKSQNGIGQQLQGKVLCRRYNNLLPRQHIRMLLMSLFYSSVALVTGYIIVKLPSNVF